MESMFRNKTKGNKTLSMSVIVVLLIAVSTVQLSTMVLANDHSGNKIYAQQSYVEIQSRTHNDGRDSTSTNPQVSNSGSPIAQAPPPHPGPPFSKQVLQTRIVDSGQKTVPAGTTSAAIASCLPYILSLV